MPKKSKKGSKNVGGWLLGTEPSVPAGANDLPPSAEAANVAARGSRRDFLKQSSFLSAIALTPGTIVRAAEEKWDEKVADVFEKIPLNLTVNGTKYSVKVEPRTTLLDLLREQLDLTGTKKGCDRGQCGACTVHVDGVRINSCLSLAVTNEGRKITTIEGLAKGEKLHPMQEAFIKHDGFQCGYCTSGQIMSAVALLKEGRAQSREQISEFMSGNICRCGAYSNIVKAIQEVKNNQA
ncbi:MAG TPA: (2Fe-2S)-binding protein [Puia sp.]|jgi:xanthine dehydrogenase YagT iron-sulfur-binding subunit